MNWDAIGSLAESIGAVGVMVSVLYLALQMRQSGKDVRANAIQELGRDYATQGALVMKDENVTAFVKGLDSYESLSPEERVKFDVCAAGFVNVVEHALYHQEAGRLDEVLEMLKAYLGPRLFAYPGFRTWWEHGQKSGFGERTQAWVDNEIALNRGASRFWHGTGAS